MNWMPKLYAYYAKTFHDLLSKDKDKDKGKDKDKDKGKDKDKDRGKGKRKGKGRGKRKGKGKCEDEGEEANGSVFATSTYNFRPRMVCFLHKDSGNLAYGMCTVTALGDFDPKKGGYLVLWECSLAIEFPPGSTILIPSATISHANTAIGTDERRYSFTQYTAGALFRWVENGCKPQNQGQSAEAVQMHPHRWLWGLSLFPNVDSCKAALG